MTGSLLRSLRRYRRQGAINPGALTFIVVIGLILAIAVYRVNSHCDPSDSSLGRFAQERIAGCAADLVRPASGGSAWSLTASQWNTRPWEDPGKSLQSEMRFRLCYRSGEAQQVYVNLGNCNPPKVSSECGILVERQCVIMTKAFGQSALEIFLPENPMPAQGTWELIDGGKPPLAPKKKRAKAGR